MHTPSVLDHLMPAFGRAPTPPPIPPDVEIGPPPDLAGYRLSGFLTSAVQIGGLVALIYGTYRASTRRSSEGE